MTQKPQVPQDSFDPDMTMHQANRPFDVQEQSSRRAMVLLIVASGFLLVLALVIFNVYQPGTRDRTAPPTINADKTPFKVRPETPGGEVTPNQNKEIYKVMDGKTIDGDVTLQKSAEVPIQIPDSANVIVKAPTPASPQAATGKEPRTASLPARPIAPANSASQNRSSGTGGDDLYVVQVASVRSRAAAEDMWRKIERDFDGLLPDKIYPDIKEADLGDKGIYYRLRISGLGEKASATHLCDQLVARKQACFVTKR